jgi:pimeloyl-ACP methyl ester carboxylesterase
VKVLGDGVVVIFIHGIRSNASVWDDFIRLIDADIKLAGVKILPYEYPAKIFRRSLRKLVPQFNAIAADLERFVDRKTHAGESVILVTHSQGGLIAQRFLARMLQAGRGLDLRRIVGLVMFACPNEGSTFLLGWRTKLPFFAKAQERELRPLNERIADTRRIIVDRVVYAREESSTKCPIDITVFAALEDNIVRRPSAESVFPNSKTLPGDHSSIVHPQNETDPSFVELRAYLLEASQRSAAAQDVGRVIAPSRAALTDPRRLIVPERRRSSLDSVFLPAVRQAVASPAIIAIYGSAGLGKSVMLAQIFDDLKTNLDLAVILISAGAKTAESAESIAQLDQQMGDALARGKALNDLIVEQRMRSLRPVILIDTLDLILDENSRSVIVGWMRRLVEDEVPIVFTCRDFDFHHQFEPIHERAPLLVDVLRTEPLQGLTTSETKEFARAYLESISHPGYELKADEFVERLLHLRAERGAIQEICRSPLLLSLACQVYAPRGEVPEDLTVARLYSSYWDSNVLRDTRRPLSSSEAASRVAFCMNAGRKLLALSGITFVEEFELAGVTSEPSDTTAAELQSVGVLIEGSRVDRFRFFHQTFAEYAIARGLAEDQDARTKFLDSLSGDERNDHLWPVLTQLLLILPAGEVYEHAIASIDVSKHPAVRAAALSAVNRSSVDELSRLLGRVRGLSSEHQKHVVEAFAALNEDVLGSGIELLDSVIEWLPEDALFTALGVLGGLIGRLTGERGPAIICSFESIRSRAQSDLGLTRQDEATRALIVSLSGALRPYGAGELQVFRHNYARLGAQARAETMRLHVGAPAEESVEMLTMALRYEMPAAGRDNAIKIMYNAFQISRVRNAMDWLTWQELLAAPLPRGWEDIQVAVVVLCMSQAEGSTLNELQELFQLAATAQQPAAQRAIYVAENLAGTQPMYVIQALLTSSVPSTGRAMSLVRTILARMPATEHDTAAQLVDWLMPVATDYGSTSVQALAFAAREHVDLLDRVLELVIGTGIGTYKLYGAELDKVVRSILDGCPAGSVAVLTARLSALVGDDRLNPETRARIAGVLAPFEDQARERCAELITGTSANQARAAAHRLADTGWAVGWFDPSYIGPLLRSPTSGAVGMIAEWIGRWQGDGTPLDERLAVEVLSALYTANAPAVARSLLAVVESDVRIRGPLFPDLLNTIEALVDRVCAGASNDGQPLDLHRTLSRGILQLLLLALSDTDDPVRLRALTFRSLNEVQWTGMSEVDEELDRLIRRADSALRGCGEGVIDELLRSMSRLTGPVQLALARATRLARGNGSMAFRQIMGATSDTNVHAFVARHLV